MRPIKQKSSLLFLLFILLISCGSSNETSTIQPPNHSGEKAVVISITTSGNENAYSFNVGILSPDTGCGQYANWWEVISENGDLIYRRILGHSHVNEQPFIRSGGSVSISKNQVVIVRAHMNTSGYGTKTFKGSVSGGFVAFETQENFANDLATQTPLPSGCAF